MTKVKKILAMDFDGVIWESVEENWEISIIAYNKMHPTAIDYNQGLQYFKKYRHYSRTTEDFYIIVYLIINKLLPINIKKINSYRKKFNDQLKVFIKHFYHIRHKNQNENFNEWLRGQSPYPGIIEKIRILKPFFEKFYITSVKDSKTIRALLDPFCIDFEIFGREISTDKLIQIQAIIEKEGIAPKNIIFVDDNVENVERVFLSGIKSALAGWGYNSPKRTKKIQKLGVTILNLETFDTDILTLLNTKL